MSKKDLNYLQELVRKMGSLISPMSYEYTLKDLKTSDAKEVFKGDFTKCVIPWKLGSQVMHLPVCNRHGMVDPQMIQFSKKLVKKLRSVGPQHDSGAEIIIAKLDKINGRLNREIPAHQSTSVKNGQVTRFTNKLINNIKGHLT